MCCRILQRDEMRERSTAAGTDWDGAHNEVQELVRHRPRNDERRDKQPQSGILPTCPMGRRVETGDEGRRYCTISGGGEVIVSTAFDEPVATSELHPLQHPTRQIPISIAIHSGRARHEIPR